jgi:uncharacterized SAM-binding protein YcdF (DUF218 family)
MIEISSTGGLDSRGLGRAVATSALLGVLAALITAQLAPWGDGDGAGTVTSVVLGVIAGIFLGGWFGPRVMISVNALLLAAYLTVALTPITTPFAHRLVRIDALPADTLDAVIALSAGVKSDSALSSVAADRLISALELMRQGRGRRIVTTRDVERRGSVTIISDSDQHRLISLASMDSVWTVVDGVHTTRDEAVRSAAVLMPANVRSIVVVTSPMHTRRACMAFEAVGFHVYCQASRERDNATNPAVGHRDRLAAARQIGYELLGMLKYDWNGWLRPRPVVTPAPGGSS